MVRLFKLCKSLTPALSVCLKHHSVGVNMYATSSLRHTVFHFLVRADACRYFVAKLSLIIVNINVISFCQGCDLLAAPFTDTFAVQLS